MDTSNLQQVFQAIDTDKNGFIDITELNVLLKSMQIDTEIGKLKNIMNRYDKDKNGVLDFNEFCEFMKLAEKTKKKHDQMQSIFKKIDTDGSNTIDKKELKALLDALGHSVTQAELNDMFNLVDTDGNGTIDFEEFKNYYKNIL